MTSKEQPLDGPVADRIYLMDGGDGVIWCDDPDPEGENEVAVEYVRVGIWRKAQPSEGSTNG